VLSVVILTSIMPNINMLIVMAPFIIFLLDKLLSKITLSNI
jgi:hypothetical protein